MDMQHWELILIKLINVIRVVFLYKSLGSVCVGVCRWRLAALALACFVLKAVSSTNLCSHSLQDLAHCFTPYMDANFCALPLCVCVCCSGNTKHICTFMVIMNLHWSPKHCDNLVYTYVLRTPVVCVCVYPFSETFCWRKRKLSHTLNTISVAVYTTHTMVFAIQTFVHRLDDVYFRNE